MWQLNLDFDAPLPDAPAEKEPSVQYEYELNRDGTRKISDFGDDLGNRRKGRKVKKNLDEDELKNRIASEPLDQVWPINSILEMQNGQHAASIWLLREYLPKRRPQNAYAKRRYVRQVYELMKMQEKLESKSLEPEDELQFVSDKMPTINQLLSAIDRKYWPEINASGFYPLQEACRMNDWDRPEGADDPVNQIQVLMPNYDRSNDTFHGWKVVIAKDLADFANQVNPVLEAFVKKKLNAPKPVEFLYRRLKSGQFEIFGRRGHTVISIDVVDVSDTAALDTYLRENKESLISKYNEAREEFGRSEFSYRPKLIRDRVGTDWRKGRDVSPERFMETFGFRGVEFGNWVSQGRDSRERQWMLNNAYDALNDLAELLNLPPKAMSLDGTLGLAFGSRGRGQALAHYEPDSFVINITKTKGYSSLAHEWFHALDHYVIRSASNDMHNFMSEFGRPIWGLSNTGVEMVKELIDDPRYVLSAIREIENTALDYPNAYAPSELSPFVRLSLNLENSENPLEHKSFEISLDQSAFIKKDRKLMSSKVRPELYHVWHDLITEIRSTRMSERTRLRAEAKGKSIESDYLYSKIEQAARCFEGYVENKLASQGKISDFLTQAAYSQKEVPVTQHFLYPYLDGDDVERVSEKFDKVFSTLKTKESKNGVMLFSRLINDVPGTSTHNVREALEKRISPEVVRNLENNGILTIADTEAEAYVLASLARAKREGKIEVLKHLVSQSKINKNTRFVVHVLEKQNPSKKTGVDCEVEIAEDALGSSPIGASVALPPIRAVTEQIKTEIQSPTGLGTTSKEHWTGKDFNFDQIYRDVDYTEELLRQIELSKNQDLDISVVTGVQGFYDSASKTSFLIAENLTEDSAYPVLLHEVGVHMAHDSVLREKFEPIMDRACVIVEKELTIDDPLAVAIQERLQNAGIDKNDVNYREELTAHLVEEVVKQQATQPAVVNWFNDVKSTINVWLVEHGWKNAASLSAMDIAKIAQNNIRALSNMREGLRLEQESSLARNEDLKLSKSSDDVELEPSLTVKENICYFAECQAVLNETLEPEDAKRLLDALKQRVSEADKQGQIYETVVREGHSVTHGGFNRGR